MIQIGVDKITPRIEYTFDFIFRKRGIDFLLTTDWEKNDISYRKREGVSSLLYENSIRKFDLKWEDENLLLDQKVDFPAVIFFHLVRYEEYLSKQKDEHGRFPFLESFFQDKIEFPLCDMWAEAFIKKVLPNWKSERKKVDILPSFDIDNTFAYQLKKGKRKWLSIAKDIINVDFSRLSERKKVLSEKQKDPYDTFDKITSIAKRFPTNIFWLVGDWSEKDRNISIENPKHQSLIRKMKLTGTLGIHPSYASFLKVEKVSKEITDLSKIIEQNIMKSRQHFLRFQLPESFQLLNDLKIKEEHSMGFAEHLGFRCGTARSIKWFDLSKNEITPLEIHPFLYMDGTLNEYMGLSPEESIEKIKEIYKKVEQFGGQFRFLWHNETIGDVGKWKGWSIVLEETLKLNKWKKSFT